MNQLSYLGSPTLYLFIKLTIKPAVLGESEKHLRHPSPGQPQCYSFAAPWSVDNCSPPDAKPPREDRRDGAKHVENTHVLKEKNTSVRPNKNQENHSCSDLQQENHSCSDLQLGYLFGFRGNTTVEKIGL